jgi:uncharacterized protein (TIGR02722 family)
LCLKKKEKKKMKKMMYVSMVALAGTLVSGCATTTREVSLDRQPMTYRLEPQDIRRTMETMVASMQQIVDLDEYGYANVRPVLDIFPVKNNTSQHLDMKSITDSLRTALSKTRMFRFVSRANAQSDITRANEDALGGLVDPTKAIPLGQQSAAQMIIRGALSEMKTREGRVTDAYYKFSLQLWDRRTGGQVWAEEQEIRKESVRPRF